MKNLKKNVSLHGMLLSLILLILLNYYILGFSYLGAQTSEKIVYLSIVLISFLGLFTCFFSRKKPRKLTFLFIVPFAFLAIYFSTLYNFSPEKIAVASMAFGESTEVVAYQYEGQFKYFFIQKDKYSILVKNTCIYSYEFPSYKSSVDWEKIDENTIQIQDSKIELNRNIFSNINCPL